MRTLSSLTKLAIGSAAFGLAASLFTGAAHAQAGGLVISQIYGGGGNASATYTNDFVELFNGTSNAISLVGDSVQYAAAGATSAFNGVATLTGSIASGGYYLVEFQSGGAVGSALPTPDAVATSINLSATAGKIALVASTTSLGTTDETGGNINSTETSNNIIDFVGYGKTAAAYEGEQMTANTADNKTSYQRAFYQPAGTATNLVDSNDNKNDFSIGNVNPHNSSNTFGVNFVASDATPEPSSILLGFAALPGLGMMILRRRRIANA